VPLKAPVAASRATSVDMLFAVGSRSKPKTGVAAKAAKAKTSVAAKVAKVAQKVAPKAPARSGPARSAPKPAAAKPVAAAKKFVAPAKKFVPPAAKKAAATAKKTFAAPKSRAQPPAVRRTGGSYALAQRNRIGGGTSSIANLVGETVGALLTPDQLRLVLGWAALVFFLFTAFPAYE
jgi:hypothetical protein